MKIHLRNPKNESFDFHELVKTVLAIMLARKNKKLVIKTEEKIGDRIADILMEDRKGIKHVWEIQKAITGTWKLRMEKQYTDLNIIPFTVSLKEVESKWEDRVLSNLMVNKTFSPIKDLREVLSVYII